MLLFSLQAQREHARVSLEAENSLSVYEAVVMKDMVNNECLWLHSVKEDAEVGVVVYSYFSFEGGMQIRGKTVPCRNRILFRCVF